MSGRPLKRTRLSLDSSGYIDSGNSSTTTLGSGGVFTGQWFEAYHYAQVTVMVNTDVASAASGLAMQFSIDGITTDRSKTVTIPAGGSSHTLVHIARYFRIVYTNGSTIQSTFRLQVIHHISKSKELTSTLTQTLTDSSDVQNVRAIIAGVMEGGDYANVRISGSKHLEVACHEPQLPFGSLHTERLTPAFQHDAVYFLNPNSFLETTSGSASTAVGVSNDNLFKCQTGTTAFSSSTIQTIKRARYRPGQGFVGRFTALFPTSTDALYCIAGYGTSESGMYVGYVNSVFGFLHIEKAAREIRSIQVTAVATGAGNVTVTLNGTATTVAVTTQSTVQAQAYELSLGTYTGWTTHVEDDTVFFVQGAALTSTGSYTFALDTATGMTCNAFSQVRAGFAATDGSGTQTFYAQSAWTVDALDGTGPSGITLDPSKGNIFEIHVKYLGFGGCALFIESGGTDHRAQRTLVHTIAFSNSRTTPTLTQPTFPFTMSATNGGATDVGVHVGSCAGFIEGDFYLTGPRFSIRNRTTGIDGNANYNILTVWNKRVFKGRANQVTVLILDIVATVFTNECIVFLVLNPTVDLTSGNVSYQNSDSSSVLAVDKSATEVTFNDGDVVYSMPINAGSTLDHAFKDRIVLEPGDRLCICATKLGGGASATAEVSLNVREDD